jgi:tetratricopeptide (TPR) repeat protein
MRAAGLMEPDAPGDVSARFSEVCCNLAQFSHGERAAWWYARADASFAQMDFGPGCGPPVPYGHVPKWAAMLAEWACFEPHAQSEAVFERARTMFRKAIAKSVETAASPGRDGEAHHARQAIIAGFIPEFHRRARMLPAEKALELLAEARTWLEELPPGEGLFTELLAKQLLCEAEMAPERHATLLREAEERFQTLLRLAPGQAGAILSNWAAALCQLARARSGEEALALYAEAGGKFEEAAKAESDAVLHNNWSSLLINEARERGRSPDLLKRAGGHAGRAEALEAGKGSYNLACIAAERADREGVVLWLERSAEYGKIPRLSHILSDRSFERFRGLQWFRELLDAIFDAGLVSAAQ